MENDRGGVGEVHAGGKWMNHHESYTIAFRILKYLREKRLKYFMAADLAKALDLTPCEVGSCLREVPGVRVYSRRRHARKESGHTWVFEEPGWQ
jgi:prophage antirepressor-like protein